MEKGADGYHGSAMIVLKGDKKKIRVIVIFLVTVKIMGVFKQN